MSNQLSDVIVSPRGARITRRWNPKDWKPEYEAMVALCATGKTQREVAEIFGYTEAWLSQIINSPKGKEVRAKIIAATRHEVSTTVAERIRDLQELGLKRMEAVLADDAIAKRSPLAIFDRSALLLKNTGVIKDKGVQPPPSQVPGNVTNIQQNTLIINGQQAKSLREGLKKADEVKQLYAPPVEKSA